MNLCAFDLLLRICHIRYVSCISREYGISNTMAEFNPKHQVLPGGAFTTEVSKSLRTFSFVHAHSPHLVALHLLRNSLH